MLLSPLKSVGVFISPERAVTRFFSLFDPRSHEGGGRQNSPKITCRPSQPIRNWPCAYRGRQDGCLSAGRRSCVEVSLRRASCRVCRAFVRVSESVARSCVWCVPHHHLPNRVPRQANCEVLLFTGTCSLHHLAVVFSIPFASSSIV